MGTTFPNKVFCVVRFLLWRGGGGKMESLLAVKFSMKSSLYPPQTISHSGCNSKDVTCINSFVDLRNAFCPSPQGVNIYSF